MSVLAWMRTLSKTRFEIFASGGAHRMPALALPAPSPPSETPRVGVEHCCVHGKCEGMAQIGERSRPPDAIRSIMRLDVFDRRATQGRDVAARFHDGSQTIRRLGGGTSAANRAMSAALRLPTRGMSIADVV